MAISLGTAYIYLRYKKPIYIVSAAVLTNVNDGMLNEVLPSNKSTNSNKTGVSLDDELNKVKLRSAVFQVVKNSNLSVNYKKKGRVVDDDLYNKSPVKFQLVRVGSPGPKEITITIKNNNAYVLKKGSKDAGEFAFNTINTNDAGSWLIAKGTAFNKFIGRTIIINFKDPELATESLLAQIEARQSTNKKNVVELSIKDNVLERGEYILGQLIGQLNSISAQEKRTESAKEIQLIELSLAALSEKVDTLQNELSHLSAADRSSELSSISTTYLQTTKKNDASLNDLSYKLQIITGLERYIKFKDLTATAPPSVFGISDPTLNGLLSQLTGLQSQHQQMLETHLDNDLVFAPLIQQTSSIKSLIRQRLDGLKSSLISSRAALEKSNSRSESSLNLLPATEKKLVYLKRRQNVNENFYAYLMQKKEEASLRGTSDSTSGKILSSSHKVDMNRKNVYSWALLIGFLLPSFIIVIQKRTYKKPL